MSFLEVKNVVKRFDNQSALNNVSINVEKGELVCILGPSGCGKTTLLRTIAGLETTDSGKIFIDGKDATFLPPAKRNFGIVFQSYALFPNMTVMGNVLFGLKQKVRASKAELRRRAEEVLEMVDLTDHSDKYPRQLSGGQQQRTALARAIALSPSFLLLDEPLSALDAKVRTKLRGEIREIQKQLGVTTVMVTHDQEEALTMADKVIVMNNSVVEQVGTPKEIYGNPATNFVAGFIGSMNFLKVDGGIKAIRPERIKLVGRFDTFDLKANVSAVEFKGPLTRVYARTKNAAEVSIELPSQSFDNMNIRAGAQVFLRLPEEHISRYTEAWGEIAV
ncbi:MAG: ATP-binding cassette domain-containing protein [Defluviitaleaceae bacterium]|nr:ATP-binding cassette domain-containing protein [Defluviitaleaceae bacterium]